MIRDTLMTIGKVFKGTVKKTAEKATKTIAEKAGQKVGEFAVEKGSKQNTKTTARAKEKTGVAGCKKETCKHFAKPSTKKSDDALMKLNRILANEI